VKVFRDGYDFSLLYSLPTLFNENVGIRIQKTKSVHWLNTQAMYCTTK